MNSFSFFQTLLFSLMLCVSLGIFPSTSYAQSENTLIKGKGPAVYFHSSNGKRYVFPTADVFKGWFPQNTSITVLTDTELADIPLGGNITHKPGSTLVKVTTDPRTYAVSQNGTLHWVTSEALAVKLYGKDWNKRVVDVPDAFFVNYVVGTPIEQEAQYSVSGELAVAILDNNVKKASLSAPVVILSKLSDPKQVNIAVFSPFGEEVGQTLIKNGTSMEDTTIALCDKSTCSIILEVNMPGKITAFTRVGDEYIASNTVSVEPAP